MKLMPNEVLQHSQAAMQAPVTPRLFFFQALSNFAGLIDVANAAEALCLRDGQKIDLNAIMAPRSVPEDQVVVVTTDKYFFVGGLGADEAATRSFERGGAGHIFKQGHGASDEERAKFYEALGLDSDGEQNLNAAPVIQAFTETFLAHVTTNVGLMSSLSQMLRSMDEPCTLEDVTYALRECVSKCDWQNIDAGISYRFTGKRYQHQLSNQQVLKLKPVEQLVTKDQFLDAWRRAVITGTLGNACAVALDVDEQGSIHYGMADFTRASQWNSYEVDAVWIPDDVALACIRSNALNAMDGTVVMKSAPQDNGPVLFSYSIDRGDTWSKLFETFDNALQHAIALNDAVANEWAIVFSKASRDYCQNLLSHYNLSMNGFGYKIGTCTIERDTGDVIAQLWEEGIHINSLAETKMYLALNKQVQATLSH